MYEEVIKRIGALRLIPVVKLEQEEDAVPLAEALCRGGLPAAEITFRTDAAAGAIRRIAGACPGMLVGAGTVLSCAQAEEALEAGAQFLVSPGTSGRLLEFASKRRVPIFPGACTPSEIMEAMEYGCGIVKFFPAVPYGGVKTIKALSAPFSQIRFMPTGGVSEENLKEFLALPQVIACGGSWMVKESLIRERRFDEIEDLARRAAELAKEEG